MSEILGSNFKQYMTATFYPFPIHHSRSFSNSVLHSKRCWRSISNWTVIWNVTEYTVTTLRDFRFPQEIATTRCAISQNSAVLIITSSSYIRVRQLHTIIHRNYWQSLVFTSSYIQRQYNLIRPDYIGAARIIIITIIYYKHQFHNKKS